MQITVWIAVTLLVGSPAAVCQVMYDQYISGGRPVHDFLREWLVEFYNVLDQIPVYVQVQFGGSGDYSVYGASLVYEGNNGAWFGVEIPAETSHRINVTEYLRPNGRGYSWPYIQVRGPFPLFVNARDRKVAPAKKETTGLVIGLNDNDSDGDDVLDLYDPRIAGQDPDLVAVTISHPEGVPVSLDYDEDIIRLYETRSKAYGSDDGSRPSEVGMNLDDHEPYHGYDDQVVYVEGIAPGTTFLTLTGPGELSDRLKISVIDPKLVADYNHDRTIDSSDEAPQVDGNLLRFWVNNDGDREDDMQSGTEDVSGSGSNGDDTQVNGRRDLIDFFPVMIDIQDLVEVVQKNECELVLKHEDEALRVVFTDLEPENSGGFMIEHFDNGFGVFLDSPPHEAFSLVISDGGTPLAGPFHDALWPIGKGVVMIEARNPTQKPLLLEIRDTFGRTICERELPLYISSTHDMYRWLNIRNAAKDTGQTGTNVTEPSNMNNPINWPDEETNGKTFVSLHGFNVEEQAARNHHDEMFKRLYWSGFNGQYIGVAWWGDESHIQLGPMDFTVDYYENVINAFQTAPTLTVALGGADVICAHSLGNMLASSAIQDCGFIADKYFALNAAVPLEAYNPVQLSTANMCHEEWTDYFEQGQDRLLAWSWYKLFKDKVDDQSNPVIDNRAELTWNGRFRDVASCMHNYYSTKEEVLADGDGGAPSMAAWAFYEIIPWIGLRGDLVWYIQEQWKGRLPSLLATVDKHAGWGFNGLYATGAEIPGIGYVVIDGPEDGPLVPDSLLRVLPYFDLFEEADETIDSYDGTALLAPLGDSDASSEAAEIGTQAKILAEAIPAQSFAAGANKVNSVGTANSDMDLDFRRVPPGKPGETFWPQRDDEAGNRWLHGDFLKPAYYFNYRLYDHIVNEGGLK